MLVIRKKALARIVSPKRRNYQTPGAIRDNDFFPQRLLELVVGIGGTAAELAGWLTRSV